MLSSPRPPKRQRSSSDSKPASVWPTKSSFPVPLLLRKLEPMIVVAKCLEAIASERILRASNLIDRVIVDQFLDMNEIQNKNNTNIKDAKTFICKQIGPILYQIINEHLADSFNDIELISAAQSSPVLVQQRKAKFQENEEVDEDEFPVEQPTNLIQNSNDKQAPIYANQMGSISIAAPDVVAADHNVNTSTDLGTWLEDSAFPAFRKNYEPIQSSSALQNFPPKLPTGLTEDFAGLAKFQWENGAMGKSENGETPKDRIPASMNTSPVQTKPPINRSQSLHGIPSADKQETRSVVSTARSKVRSSQGRSQSNAIRACTFCNKDLPSPSARREHEAIHIFQLAQYKQFQCKRCNYRSHRPREIFAHMKAKHDWAKKGRGVLEDLVDHGPLSEERMAALRKQYKSEINDGINLTSANFSNFQVPSNPKAPDRDQDRDDLGNISTLAPPRKRVRLSKHLANSINFVRVK
ncbi:hypothetical protein TWF694_011200 [Orbilia ellipsospora]|uniref:C2H2-type domain-containing protein n=1 Tax=Orbilia ellipsospora TaxID=2528407 RepID=A0AAV9X8P9_9PEZI